MVGSNPQNRRYAVILGFMIVTIIFLLGCSSLTKKNDTATAPSAKSESGVPALYYDFGDVLVPKELKIDKKSSFIYQTEGFSAGVLV